MQSLMDGLARALTYIEERLTEELTPELIAKQAYVSSYHFQRLFHAACGMSLGEYIRRRRLTVAGQELSKGDMKVLDAALKYGYDSPDSFARAFQRFHGVLPSQAREKGVRLNAFSPMQIYLTLKGGTVMEFSIVEKPAFAVVGMGRMFDNETSYDEIPKYWEEFIARGEDNPVCGDFGACLDMDGKLFKYLIADEYHEGEPVPEGCEKADFPAGTWAVFPCTMSTLQDTNTRMWKEWLPSNPHYRLAGSYNLERYMCCDSQDAVELWLPVEKC